MGDALRTRLRGVVRSFGHNAQEVAQTVVPPKNPELVVGQPIRLIAQSRIVSPEQITVIAEAQADGTTKVWPEERSRGITVDVFGGASNKTYFGSAGRPAVLPGNDLLNLDMRIGVTSEGGVPSRNYPGSKPSQDVEFWSVGTLGKLVHGEDESGEVFWNEMND
jgi:hypothetical protein